VSAKDGSTTCPFALNVYKGFKEETADNVPAAGPEGWPRWDLK
jgi:hypothetical protein